MSVARPGPLRVLVTLAHEWLRLLTMGLAAAVSLFMPQGVQIREKRHGAGRLEGAKRLAIFSHFDRHGEVHDYVLYYLAALRKAGFEIVFVSNCRRLSEDSWQRILPLCAVALRRRNFGHDFGAFKDALTLIGDLGRLDDLLFANDSVYGPFWDLPPLLERCDPAIADIWGITDCWDGKYHLQSYFLLFTQQALKHSAFAEFWRKVRLVPSRTWAIRKYEVGLTQAMLQGGLRCAALFPYRKLAAGLLDAVMERGLLQREDLSDYHRSYAAKLFSWVELGTPLNPTHFFWDHLIGEGAPFLKRDLLLRNPMGVPYVSLWEDVIRKRSDYDPNLILHHLESRARKRAV
jgi:lipopolysaccharide biosynthesis protein